MTSKVFERNMDKLIIKYIEKYLSPYIFRFQKENSAEQCLILMIEMLKRALDKNNMEELFFKICQSIRLAKSPVTYSQD